MISICATPKAFKGHIGIIQENAIKSWLGHSEYEVILLGNENGVAEMAKKYNVRHIPDIKVNDFGTPLLDDIFEKIQKEAKYETICYVSADVILFIRGFRIKTNAFLAVGYRHDTGVDKLLDFNKPINIKGLKRHNASGCDYWIFRKGMYAKFPSFTVGRGAQEGWMIWHAKKHGVKVIDFSRYISAIHQNHDYSHLARGMGWWKGEEFKRNIDLAGGFFHFRTLRDVDYELIDGEVKKKKLTWYKVFFGNPVGQWILGFKRLINYYL